MEDRPFHDMLLDKWSQGKFVCVGLDSDYIQLPDCVRRDDVAQSIYAFNAAIIDATKHLVCAYKPNISFYRKMGPAGMEALNETCKDIHLLAKDVPIILDAKYQETKESNIGNAAEAFDVFRADAVTIGPYMGHDAAIPFLNRVDKGIFILCRTSNPGAGEFQDLPINGQPLYQHVARHVTFNWNGNLNCGLVVGATGPDEIRIVRSIVGEMPLLIPGVGAQGGDVAKTVATALNSQGDGFIINSSRDIIFASKGKDFAEAARRKTQALHTQISTARLAYR